MDRGLDSEEALADLYRFAIFYDQLIHAETGIQELNPILRHINAMDSRVVYHYFSWCWRWLPTGEVSRDNVGEVAWIMESYSFPTEGLSTPTNGLNRTVIALCDETKAAGDYRARLVSLLNASFPDNKNLQTAWWMLTCTVYEII